MLRVRPGACFKEARRGGVGAREVTEAPKTANSRLERNSFDLPTRFSLNVTDDGTSKVSSRSCGSALGPMIVVDVVEGRFLIALRM